MDSLTTHAWILLSIPRQGASVNDVLWRASAINHTEPTETELRSSLQWLRTAGLIVEDGDRFVPTPFGRRVVEESWKNESMVATWDAIAIRLASVCSRTPAC
jgi:hypothetical protein